MQKIDFDALDKNARYFKSVLGNSKLCAVVKNDAYGHGIERVASRLAAFADFFAVGSIDEARKIKCYKENVLILIPQNERDIREAVSSGYILTVDSFDTLNLTESAAKQLGKTAQIHIKINSGMSRLGFNNWQLSKLIDRLYKNGYLNVTGVFSHFWGEETHSCDNQLKLFLTAAETLEIGLKTALIKHIANTSGALLNKKYRLDMARIGLGLYGYGDKNLLPVKTVTSRVVAVNKVKRGERVGYGGKFVCGGDRNIATIATGYAQGFPRLLKGANVFANGKYYPVVAVCMAMCMLDLGSDTLAVGDEVVLLGKNVDISTDDVIIYELLCNLK